MANLVGILFKQDTIIKKSPVSSSELPSNQKQNIPAGTFLILQSYGDPSANDNHYKLSFKDIQFKGSSMNWYAFAPHVQINQQPLKSVQSVSDVVSKQTEKNVVKIIVDKKTVPAQGSFLKLVFNTDTIIKLEAVDAKFLNDNSKQAIPAGTELVLVTEKPDANNAVKLPIDNSHVKVTFKDIEFKGFSQNWYAFMGHVGIQRLG
ncbi:MAG: hypothetical protein AB1589_18740 [Cyanobacteriota bacterium]